MLNSNFTTQVCPTCGRSLRIHVDFMQERVVCKHCHADFVATGSRPDSPPQDCWRSNLLERANELLELVEG